MRRYVPHPEDFLSWRESPITAFFLQAMRAYAEQRREIWISMSWGAGNNEEKTLHGLRGQADSALWFADLKEVELLEELIYGDEDERSGDGMVAPDAGHAG